MNYFNLSEVIHKLERLSTYLSTFLNVVAQELSRAESIVHLASFVENKRCHRG